MITNVMLRGVLIGSYTLSLDKSSMEAALKERLPKVFDMNLITFNKSLELIGR